MSGARLRRTFKYPSGSDDDSLPEAIDEQEQEQLIASLQERDSSNTFLYKRIFLAIPLISIVPYFLFGPGFIVSALCISSLLTSAFILERIPLPASQIGWKGWLLIPHELSDGPFQKFLVPLNGALAGVLALGGYVGLARGGEDVVLNILPMCVFIAILIARAQLRPIDIDSLSRLKYNYKGA